MQLSTAGLNFIKQAEGFRSHTYRDAAGVPTIGYGHHLLHSQSFPWRHRPVRSNRNPRHRRWRRRTSRAAASKSRAHPGPVRRPRRLLLQSRPGAPCLINLTQSAKWGPLRRRSRAASALGPGWRQATRRPQSPPRRRTESLERRFNSVHPNRRLIKNRTRAQSLVPQSLPSGFFHHLKPLIPL